MIDRFASLLRGAGDTLRRAGDAMKTSAATMSPVIMPSTNPTVVSPGVNLPGVTRWSTTQGRNAKIDEALRTVESYFGRVSYDAGPTMTRFSSYPASDISPEKIIGAQQEAIAGYPHRWSEMIEQVLSRDSHLAGIAQQRVDDVVKGSWRLVRSKNDDIAACIRSFCEESIRGVDEFEDAFAWLLWGNAYCYSAFEIIWKRARITFPGPDGKTVGPVDAIVPARLEPVHAKHFRFDLRTDEPYLWLGGSMVSLPYGKFVFYRGEGQHPITERRGYMWQCVWLSMFRSIGWAGWATYVDRFGMPIPMIGYQGEIAQYNEFKAAYSDILNSLGSGKGAVYPRDAAQFDIKDPPSGGRASDPHSALSDACDSAQSVRVLGATLTAKIGNVGSFSASSAHLEVKYAKEEADARRGWAAMRPQLLGPIVRINAEAIAEALYTAGYRVTPESVLNRVPRGQHRVPREVDPLQRAELISKAVNEWCIPIGVEALYDTFDLPQPMSEADKVPGKPQPVTAGGKVVSSVEASTEGAEAPKDPPPDDDGDDIDGEKPPTQ